MEAPEHADPDFGHLPYETRDLIARGLVGAVTPPGGLDPLQRRLLRSIGSVILGLDFCPLGRGRPASAEALAAVLCTLEAPVRQRTVQFMVVLELVLHPLPEAVCERVGDYAEALGVDEGMIAVARRFAEGAYGLALQDLARNGYFHDWDDHGRVEDKLHVHERLVTPFQAFHADEGLHAHWSRLNALPEGTLGAAVARFYRARGFAYPGRADSVSPTLAQHDFVHVLADYGSVIEGEIETFAFIASACPDPRGFSWLAAVLSVFETGTIPAIAGGVLEADPGHLRSEGMTTRLADALRRGRHCHHDLIYGLDWFALAPEPLDAVRAQLGVVPKGRQAVAAGSAGVFERAGMSAWQLEHGDPAFQPSA